jgi:hypothetical protein
MKEAQHAGYGLFRRSDCSDLGRRDGTGSNLRPTLPSLHADLRPTQRHQLQLHIDDQLQVAGAGPLSAMFGQPIFRAKAEVAALSSATP